MKIEIHGLTYRRDGEKEITMKEFTEDEKIIAKNIDKRYKWIARDSNGRLYLYQYKPNKLYGCWDNAQTPVINFRCFDSIFISIKWEDNEPTRISDIYIEQIVDDVEREYLKEVIKPFRKIVEGVVKSGDLYNNKGIFEEEYLVIKLHGKDNIAFPSFKAGKMYSGMAINHEYALEELGITYDN